MGKLTYDSTLVADFDDRVLAHLQIVIASKLRRGEGFIFSWRDNQDTGDGRTALWMAPGIPLAFKYNGGRHPSINRNWVEALHQASIATAGLRIVPEPAPPEEPV
ncbi:ATP-dependent DNA ligase [Curtobacterium sp. MCBD17_026]|uniref:DUF7882 family protein n=1 Tax=Curtobacterium sp. MCBD17_026 TaxID=2175621 RepID=UPI000DA786CA|nr:ATP-dependent DNA ligase [Curtobacterium sp. MCBD17_026]WIB72515.1 ATP-dependent DNA ligase [Curtobacterium sp. MCBD17_026]